MFQSSLKRLKQCPHFPGRIAEKKNHTMYRNLGIHDNKFLILILVHALIRSHHSKSNFFICLLLLPLKGSGILVNQYRVFYAVIHETFYMKSVKLIFIDCPIIKQSRRTQ